MTVKYYDTLVITYQIEIKNRPEDALQPAIADLLAQMAKDSRMTAGDSTDKDIPVDYIANLTVTTIDLDNPKIFIDRDIKFPVTVIPSSYLKLAGKKLYSEKSVIGLMKADYYDGYTDREQEFREAE